MVIFSLTLKITVYISIGTCGNGKDVLNGINSRDKCFEGKMNILSIIITTTL